ncbi:MAG TPA: dipeptidase [Symbiobacteriaceae bacterium]|nr:dipeptidase [Symbiobacteriaceae bacterium]
MDQYFAANRDRHLEELKAFLAFPSISTLSSHAGDLRACAEWLKAACLQVGLTKAEVMETGGHPLVYAERIEDPALPTALIYGHYDVQPVDPLHLWENPPFEAVIKENKIWARGAVDDKGQVFMHLKAIEGLLKLEGKLPINLKLLIEGEEESGSVNLERFVESHTDLLQADVVVISDTALYAPGVPSLTYALRGLAALEFTVTGAKGDLHSGVYGGASPNAAQALARLVATLHTPEGGVAVKGFYDGVRALSAEERENFASLRFDEAELKTELKVSALPGEPGFSALERMWARPTLEINGIYGGFQGEGTKTVIPCEATAKVTCRLVPDQDPVQVQDAIEAHLKANVPPGVSVTVKRKEGTPAAITPIEHPAIQAAMKSLSEGYGAEAKFIRSGGSIPIVGLFQRTMDLPSVLMGFGLETEQVHAPNEHFHLENFDKGLRVLYTYWHELASAMK